MRADSIRARLRRRTSPASGLDRADGDLVEVHLAEAHVVGGLHVGDVGAGEIEERGGVGVGGDDVSARQYGVEPLDVVQVAAGGPVGGEHAHGVDDGERGPAHADEVGGALADVGVDVRRVEDDAEEVLAAARLRRVEPVVLGDRHVDEDVAGEHVRVDGPRGEVEAVGDAVLAEPGGRHDLHLPARLLHRRLDAAHLVRLFRRTSERQVHDAHATGVRAARRHSETSVATTSGLVVAAYSGP